MEDVCANEVIDENKVLESKAFLEADAIIQQQADTFRVLSDPTRLKIVKALSRVELCVCELAAILELTMPAISYQLRLLRLHRLVRYRKAGKMVYYSLDDSHILSLLQITEDHIAESGN